jgi:hypothetical protein
MCREAPRGGIVFQKKNKQKMLLSVDFAQVANAPSALMLTLMIASMISGVTAPKTKKDETSDTCTSDCCRVIYIWKKMGKSISVDPTSATACCYYLVSISQNFFTTQTSGIWGVTCTSDGTVFRINWDTLTVTARTQKKVVYDLFLVFEFPL